MTLESSNHTGISSDEAQGIAWETTNYMGISKGGHQNYKLK